MLRTHTCNELNKDFIGKKVKLGGWVHSIRDHGNLVFIDLRDNYGITQCVIDHEKNAELVKIASNIRDESVIFIEGTVIERANESINPDLDTGEIEISVKDIYSSLSTILIFIACFFTINVLILSHPFQYFIKHLF